MKSKKPIVALIYDFDFTLLKGNMQEHGLIGDLGYTVKEFWSKVTDYARAEKMDANLACMLFVKKAIENSGKKFDRDFLRSYGKSLNGHFMPGVEQWFDAINSVGDTLGLSIEHYVISSGFREIVEGSDIFPYFSEVFSCEFQYGPNGDAFWPKNIINYTGKTQYIARITKGALDLADSNKVNAVVDDDRRIPYDMVVYFGDGFTDIPCMTMVKSNGGYAIGVYSESREVADKLLLDQRVNFIAKADYSKDNELFSIVSKILNSMVAKQQLKDVEKSQHRSWKIGFN